MCKFVASKHAVFVIEFHEKIKILIMVEQKLNSQIKYWCCMGWENECLSPQRRHIYNSGEYFVEDILLLLLKPKISLKNFVKVRQTLSKHCQSQKVALV